MLSITLCIFIPIIHYCIMLFPLNNIYFWLCINLKNVVVFLEIICV